MDHMETAPDPEVRAAVLVPGGRQQRLASASSAGPQPTRPSPAGSSIVAGSRTSSARSTSRPAWTCSAARTSPRRRRGDPHTVTIVRGGIGGEESTIKARWVVDATGRAFTLKKQLGLLEDNGHMVNSAWFRLAGGLDIEDWADPDDEEFFARMSERGLRQVSTNHLCGKGYWVWMIPLSSGPISIGIVADSNFHSMGGDEHARRRDRLDPPARAAARRGDRQPA